MLVLRGDAGISGCARRIYSRSARLRGLASATGELSYPRCADTWRVSVGRVPCAAGVYPLRMQRRPVSVGPAARVSAGRCRRIYDPRRQRGLGVGPGGRIHQRPAVLCCDASSLLFRLFFLV